eukprot:364411-Chlamydomonas_euryale.AAC.6
MRVAGEAGAVTVPTRLGPRLLLAPLLAWHHKVRRAHAWGLEATASPVAFWHGGWKPLPDLLLLAWGLEASA